jgi:hypothetical protein
MKSEIKGLGERVSRLNKTEQPGLTTEEANMVRAFWIRLNYSPEEGEEEVALEKRSEILYQNWLARKSLPGEQEEFSKVSARSTEIAHDIVMMRVIANHALRDRVWPEFVTRVLRFRQLTDETSTDLSSDESKELETLLEWFNELQCEALKKSEMEST